MEEINTKFLHIMVISEHQEDALASALYLPEVIERISEFMNYETVITDYIHFKNIFKVSKLLDIECSKTLRKKN